MRFSINSKKSSINASSVVFSRDPSTSTTSMISGWEAAALASRQVPFPSTSKRQSIETIKNSFFRNHPVKCYQAVFPEASRSYSLETTSTRLVLETILKSLAST